MVSKFFSGQFFLNSFSIAVACTAMAVLSVSKMRVVKTKLVSIFTMGFSCALSSSQIFTTSYRLKMCGVDAISYAAKMVKLKTFRNRTTTDFIRISMGKMSLFISNKLAVPVSKRSFPKPTRTSLFHLFPKQLVHAYSSTGLGVLGQVQDWTGAGP